MKKDTKKLFVNKFPKMAEWWLVHFKFNVSFDPLDPNCLFSNYFNYYFIFYFQTTIGGVTEKTKFLAHRLPAPLLRHLGKFILSFLMFKYYLWRCLIIYLHSLPNLIGPQKKNRETTAPVLLNLNFKFIQK